MTLAALLALRLPRTHGSQGPAPLRDSEPVAA